MSRFFSHFRNFSSITPYPVASAALHVLVTTTLVLLSPSTQAFSPSVHGRLCDSAYHLLNPKQQHWLNEQVQWQHFPKHERKQHARKQKGQSALNYACQRPDFIKIRSRAHHGQISPGGKHRASSHYINLAADEKRFEWQKICRQQLCTTDAIRFSIATFLKSQSAAERSEHLGIAGHLLADLHQPLHVGFGEDRGGNTIKVYWRSNTKGTNLHRLWDGDLPWELDFDAKPSLANPLTFKDRYLEAWAKESFQIARDRAYVHPSGVRIKSGDRLGQAYFQFVKEKARDRIEKAQGRIAGLWVWLYQESQTN